MSPDYHKMVRNSAKILRRREQTRKAIESDGGADDEDDALERAAAQSAVSAPSIKSAGSALSLSKHTHVQKWVIFSPFFLLKRFLF